MTKRLLPLVGMAVFMAAAPVRSEPADYQTIKELEKAAMTLTGKPLERDVKERFLAGETSADDVIDTLSKSDGFVEYFAKFWSDIIGIRTVQSLGSLRVRGANTTVQNILSPFTNTNLRKDSVDLVVLPPDNPAALYENRRTAHDFNKALILRYDNWTGPMRLVFFQCGGEVWIRSAFLNTQSLADARSVVATGSYVEGGISLPKVNLPAYAGLSGAALRNRRQADAVKVFQDVIATEEKIAPNCALPANMTSVTPYWDKGAKVKYRAATYLLAAGRCQADLSGCFSDVATFAYLRTIDEDSTLEPGRIIGKTVADDLDFKTILTTTKTVMTGRMAYFLNKKLPDDIWTKNFPNGRYPDQQPQFLQPNSESKNLFWVERGEDHAGVLTTSSYHLITNGRRAKANRAFEAFTCSKFTVPVGAVPDPEDANPDLRQRKYCSYCHRTLEPMAAFFNRYPETGRVNFEYDPSDEIDDSGLFRGDAGAGVPDYGAFLAKSVSFDQCSIRRAFEFVHGREFTAAEAKVLVPEYLEVLKNANNNLRPVIKAMLKARAFTASHEPGVTP